MDQLSEAVDRLREGKGRSSASAGTRAQGRAGLSRSSRPRWISRRSIGGRAGLRLFPESPLFPRNGHDEAGAEDRGGRSSLEDPEKVESRIEHLVGRRGDIILTSEACLGWTIPKVEWTSPIPGSTWFASGVSRNICSAAVRIAPTVFCLEDIHWG